MKKKISLVIYVLFNIILFYNTVFAEDVSGLSKGLYNFSNDNKIFTMGSNIAGWVIYAAIIVCVVTLMVKGIKFITSSPEGQASVKKELIPWAIGIIILFSARIVLNFINNFAQNNINTL